MKLGFGWVIAVVVTVTTVGCASIMHGTTQNIGISSSPTGAKVTADDMLLGTTPMFAELKRNEEHIVTIEMDGYEKAQLTLTKNISGWVWGNIIFGGLIGLAIDAISGGIYSLSPEQLNAEMRKNGGNVSSTMNGIYVVAVLQPDPAWQKIGNLNSAQMH